MPPPTFTVATPPVTVVVIPPSLPSETESNDNPRPTLPSAIAGGFGSPFTGLPTQMTSPASNLLGNLGPLSDQMVLMTDPEQFRTEPLEQGEILEQRPRYSKDELELASKGYAWYLRGWCQDHIRRYGPPTNPLPILANHLRHLGSNDIERIIDALPGMGIILPTIKLKGGDRYDNYDNILPLPDLCKLLSLPIRDGKVLGEGGDEWLESYREQYDTWDIVIQEHTGYNIESILNREDIKSAWKKDVRARAIRFR